MKNALTAEKPHPVWVYIYGLNASMCDSTLACGGDELNFTGSTWEPRR